MLRNKKRHKKIENGERTADRMNEPVRGEQNQMKENRMKTIRQIIEAFLLYNIYS